jgi:hypothetical protein
MPNQRLILTKGWERFEPESVNSRRQINFIESVGEKVAKTTLLKDIFGWGESW